MINIKCSYSMLFTPSCGWPQTTHGKQIGQLLTCWIEFTKLTTAQFGPHLQASGDMWLCRVVMICPQNILSSASSYALKKFGFKDRVPFSNSKRNTVGPVGSELPRCWFVCHRCSMALGHIPVEVSWKCKPSTQSGRTNLEFEVVWYGSISKRNVRVIVLA